MLLAFLALISLLPPLSLTEPPRMLPRASGSVGPTPGLPTYECWEHSDSKHNHLDTVNARDCAKALTRIMDSDKAKAPMLFSRSKDVGYLVPDQIEAGTCIVHIDIAKDSLDKVVQLPMESVAGAALHIMEHCIKDEPFHTGLGGHAVALPRHASGGGLDVVLFGQPAPEVPNPRVPYLRMVASDTGAIRIVQA